MAKALGGSLIRFPQKMRGNKKRMVHVVTNAKKLKAGAAITKFEAEDGSVQIVPNKKMLNLLDVMSDPNTPVTITGICKAAGISDHYYKALFADPDFNKWFMDQWHQRMKQYEPMLDKIGLIQSQKKFSYWEAMQMKYGGYAKKEENKTDVRVAGVIILPPKLNEQEKASQDQSGVNG